MTTLEDLWLGVEMAGPDNPGPLLVAADAADEEGKPLLAYALRWCAGHQKRPEHRVHISRFPWRWMREQKDYRRLSKVQARKLAFAILPRQVFDSGIGQVPDAWVEDFQVSIGAYQDLGAALGYLRQVVEVPKIVLPPQPEIVRTNPLTCAQCGIMRSRDVEICPVCYSTEVRLPPPESKVPTAPEQPT